MFENAPAAQSTAHPSNDREQDHEDRRQDPVCRRIPDANPLARLRGSAESHLRELLEQGFEVAVVADATAAAQVEEGDGYAAALVNFRFLANTVWTTEEAVAAMRAD